MVTTEKIRDLSQRVDEFNADIKARYRNPIKKRRRGQKEIVFTMGLPAAGKTTLVNKRYGKKKGWEIIDSDLISVALPGYDPNDPSKTHTRAEEMAEDLYQNTLRQRDNPNIVLDSTGIKISKITRRIRDARFAGYHVKLLYVTVPLEISLVRNAKRDRHVPRSIIMDKARDVRSAFDQVSRLVDQVEVFDNAPKGKALKREIKSGWGMEKADYVPLDMVGTYGNPSPKSTAPPASPGTRHRHPRSAR